jgi:hypothetical protein
MYFVAECCISETAFFVESNIVIFGIEMFGRSPRKFKPLRDPWKRIKQETLR